MPQDKNTTKHKIKNWLILLLLCTNVYAVGYIISAGHDLQPILDEVNECRHKEWIAEHPQPYREPQHIPTFDPEQLKAIGVVS